MSKRERYGLECKILQFEPVILSAEMPLSEGIKEAKSHRKVSSQIMKSKTKKRSHPNTGMVTVLLLLRRELRLSNALAPQLHVENSLHVRQYLLVRRRCSSLKVLHDTDRCVAFRRELLLRHLVSFFSAALLDRFADLGSDGLGLDDLVAAINFGEMLAVLGGADLAKHAMSVLV